MRQINVDITPDKFVITTRRAANIPELIASAFMALIVCPSIFVLLFLAQFALSSWYAMLGAFLDLFFILPFVYFVYLVLVHLYRMLIPRVIVFDRLTGALSTPNGNKLLLHNLADLKLVYTGYTSPSRYRLKAFASDGKSVELAKTGFTGSRQELVQLAQMIADFLQRPDLVSHIQQTAVR